jgi:hypothetical protein
LLKFFRLQKCKQRQLCEIVSPVKSAIGGGFLTPQSRKAMRRWLFRDPFAAVLPIGLGFSSQFHFQTREKHMSGRGRKPNLKVIPQVPGAGRPEPASDLPSAEAAIWRYLVGTMPAHWFASSEPLLRCLCSTLATCDALAARITTARKEANWKLLDRLTRIHERQTKCAADLAGKLRLTPRSKTSVEQAANLRQIPPLSTRPWEMGKTQS